MTKILCSAPWVGLTINEDGHVRTCCAGSESLGNLNDCTITDIVQSPVLHSIQKELAAGTVPTNCQSCIQIENKTGHSLRHHYQTNYPTIPTTQELRFLDIRWNNQCNLTCVYCDPQYSSSWASALGVAVDRAKKPYQNELLDWILDRVHQVEEIMLVGGEPMLMRQNHILFQTLPKSARISLVTNLSYDIANLPCIKDLLDRPSENIIWNVSLENTHEKFEYIRNGASWDQVFRNLSFLLEHWPNTVTLGMVYAIFSAFDLETTVDFFMDLGLHKFNLVSIKGQPEFDVFRYPAPVRQAASDILNKVRENHNRLLGIDSDLHPINGLNSMLDMLQLSNITAPMTWKQLQKRIDSCDRFQTKYQFRNLWRNELATIESLIA